MNDNFNAFMAQSAIQYKEVEYVASNRFLDEKGNPISWKIKILSETELDKLKNQCKKRIVDEKTRRTTIETDTDKLTDLLVENCVVYPNLNNANLQDSYKAVGAIDLAKKMLMPGEYADLALAINQAMGFKCDMGEKIKYVKN